MSMLISAARDGDLERVRELLNDGADPNIINHGFNALIWASMNGNIKIVELLLNHGSDLNLQDNEGDTALMMAVIKGHIDPIEYIYQGYPAIVKLLLNHGSDPNLQNNEGDTALIQATYDGNIKVVKEILNSDVDVDLDIQNNNGETALMRASMLLEVPELNFDWWNSPGYPKLELANIIELLLDHDADPNIPNNNGDTVLMIASNKRRKDIVRLLMNHMDKIDDSRPDEPNIEQMRNESARNIQRTIRGKQTRRKLSKQRPQYGRMVTPTTNREKMRRWMDSSRTSDEDDPIRGYEQFSFFPERLVPDVSKGTWMESDENERIADYLDSLKQYGGKKKRRKSKKKRRKTKKKKKNNR